MPSAFPFSSSFLSSPFLSYFPSFPLFSSSLYFLLSSPILFLFFLSLQLEGLEERSKLPQRGNRNRIWWILAFRIWHLLATNLIIFYVINWLNLLQFKQYRQTRVAWHYNFKSRQGRSQNFCSAEFDLPLLCPLSLFFNFLFSFTSVLFFLSFLFLFPFFPFPCLRSRTLKSS